MLSEKVTSMSQDQVAIAIVIVTLTPPTNFMENVAHGKRPVHRTSAQGSEILLVMVEHPWALTQDTMVFIIQLCYCRASVGQA